MSNKIVWTGVAVGSVLAVGVMAAYFSALGSYSNQVESWAAFGSVLSAAFTLLATFATLATLISVLNQQKAQATINLKQSEINEEQLKATRFQQYLSHRALFIERLQSLEKDLKINYRFTALDTFYNNIFTLNSPFRCDYQVALTTSDYLPDSYPDLLNSFESLKRRLKTPDFSVNDAKELAVEIIQLLSQLNMEYWGNGKLGNVWLKYTDHGVNIYSIHESIHSITLVLKSIASYTGSPEIEDISYLAQSKIIRDKLIQCFLVITPPKHELYAWKASPGLETLERIYITSLNIRENDGSYSLPITVRYLERFFASSEIVNEISDIPSRMRDIHNELSSENVTAYFQAQIKHTENEESLKDCLEMWSFLDAELMINEKRINE